MLIQPAELKFRQFWYTKDIFMFMQIDLLVITGVFDYLSVITGFLTFVSVIAVVFTTGLMSF